ncbi:hypothetical protein CAPTEDRAFT_148410 [Capitella teleta]|uniref:SAM domain-containing protein n=1 Tax=Capitella teleta TaxID=283909 RepID=R7ULF7_CAPTE|nr:hypothetical protein CAPTEDRAFT_148410 [Capitella teleta]|eukprot:ELU04767.1 hypothetical protein CAPTEDRAFT_148410 [Capitella teleta]
MRLEVPNKDEDDTYWVATVMMAAGQLLRLRFEGFQDNSTCDFWLDACASDLHPVGWCRSNEKKYSPPQVVKDKVEKWEDLLNELTESQSSSTHGATQKLSGTAPIDQIQTDTWLEVQNDHNPHTVWLAKVIQNVGGRLRLQHAGELATFWLFYLNCRLHPIGWAAELEYQLEPPPSVLKYLGSEEKCKEELTKAQSLADDNPFPSHIFEDLEQAAPHEFKEGWRLEAIHPVTHATLHPATVSKVIDDTYFMVQIDDLKETPSVQMCCHGNSPGLFPIHWSMYKGVKLVSPKGWSKSDFDWKEYLEAVKAEAAPESSFTNTFIPEHEFKRGMKLEVVDPIQPDAICAATITRVHDQLLWLHLDSANKMLSNYIVHVDSNDIFPIGWCDCNNYPLRPPKRSSYKKSSKKVAIVQPDKTPFCFIILFFSLSQGNICQQMNTEFNSKLYPGNGWCPKIYFNHRCFSGAYLSKGRIAALPRCVGPGPVVLVMKEVLTMLINVAYKSSRVLRELQLEGEADPSMHLQILKAKYKGKSYCAKVEICKTRSQIEEFCRQICITLECCPNLFSTHHYEGNCPSNCWQLTKTKYSAYFGKKKKKRVGRPPGGHTNLENGPQKPGKRRRGRPPNRPSIFNTQETSTQENKEDAESVVSMETGSSCSLTEKPADVASIDREFVPKRKYKRRLPTAPMEMKTRGVKLPRYSHNMKQNKAPLPASSHDHDLLQLNSNPLYWTTEEVVEFLENTDCSDLTSIFQDQEIDGQAFMLLSLPTIQEYLELKLGPSIKLCHHIEQVKIAFYEQWA